MDESWVVVGLDNGGNKNNATVVDPAGRFLVDSLVETPSRVQEGPEIALQALVESFDGILERTGVARERVRAVGFDTPGPASAQGVISSRGSTNFSHPGWRGFDFRGALEKRLALPVVYNNDGNAASLYAHHVLFGAEAGSRSSVSAIVGTGLGSGVVEQGRIIKGAAGFAGELGHVHIPMAGLLAEGQPVPRCNCGFVGDAESVASLTAIEKNLLPYWLTQFAGHELGRVGDLAKAAKLVRVLRGEGRSPGPQDLRAAGHGHRAALHHRRELHGPRRLLRGGRGGGGGRPRSATGSWTRSRRTPPCARSRPRWRDSPWCPTGTWRGLGGPPWPPWSRCTRGPPRRG